MKKINLLFAIFIIIVLIIIFELGYLVFAPKNHSTTAVIPTPLPGHTHAVTVVSDVSSVKVTAVNQQALLNVLNQANFFVPYHVRNYDRSAPKLGADITVKNVVYHLTDKQQPDGQIENNSPKYSKNPFVYMSFGMQYNASTQNADIYLYVLPSDIKSLSLSDLQGRFVTDLLYSAFEYTDLSFIGPGVNDALPFIKQHIGPMRGRAGLSPPRMETVCRHRPHARTGGTSISSRFEALVNVNP